MDRVKEHWPANTPALVDEGSGTRVCTWHNWVWVGVGKPALLAQIFGHAALCRAIVAEGGRTGQEEQGMPACVLTDYRCTMTWGIDTDEGEEKGQMKCEFQLWRL